jgi:hypothetical protein
MGKDQGSSTKTRIKGEELVREISIKAELMFRKLRQLVQDGFQLGKTE